MGVVTPPGDRTRTLARYLAPLGVTAIRTARDLRRSPQDPNRYDDAALLEALRDMAPAYGDVPA